MCVLVQEKGRKDVLQAAFTIKEKRTQNPSLKCAPAMRYAEFRKIGSAENGSVKQREQSHWENCKKHNRTLSVVCEFWQGWPRN